MASVLGQLLIELGINTAAFKDGMDKATYQAKVFADKAKDAFSEVGGEIGKMTTEMLGLPPALGNMISGITSSFGSFSGSAAGVGGIVAGIGVAAATTSLAVIGMVVHLADASKQIIALSQSTGVSVSDLSALQGISKAVGVSIDAVGKGLQKLGRNAYEASTGSGTAAKAFQTLGIAVTTSNGNMKDQNELFTEVSNKFAGMNDGAQKTALAMQIFGKAGADLIPLLNQGGEKIAEFREHAEKLGAVMSDDVAAAANKLADNLDMLELAGQGVQNKLLQGLTPALTVFTKQLVSGLEDSQSQVSMFVDGLVILGKAGINVFQGIGQAVSQVGLFIKHFAADILITVDGFSAMFSALKNGDWKGIAQAKENADKSLEEESNRYAQEATASWNEYSKNSVAVWTASIDKIKEKSKTSSNDIAQSNIAEIQKVRDAISKAYAEMQPEEKDPIQKIEDKTNAEKQKLIDLWYKLGDDVFNKAFSGGLTAALTHLDELSAKMKDIAFSEEMQKIMAVAGKSAPKMPTLDAGAAPEMPTLDMTNLFKGTINSSQELQNALQNLHREFRSGKIDAQQYMEAVQRAKDAFGIKQGAKSAFDDFNASIKTSGELMHDVMLTGLQGISDAFTDMVVKGKADWQGLLESMESMLLKSAIQNLISKLLGSLSGIGGPLGNVFSGIFGGVTGHADGGDMTPGKPYLVGERGPELIVPKAAGTVIPNGKFGGGGTKIEQHFHISTPNADSFMKSKTQIMAEMYKAQMASARRAG